MCLSFAILKIYQGNQKFHSMSYFANTNDICKNNADIPSVYFKFNLKS